MFGIFKSRKDARLFIIQSLTGCVMSEQKTRYKLCCDITWKVYPSTGPQGIERFKHW